MTINSSIENKRYKAAEKINKILNDFLEPFDCDAVFSGDFCYWTTENRIGVALFVVDSSAKAFIKNAEERFPDIKADVFLWSFFHELGHHETEDDFEQNEWDYYRDCIEREISDEEYFNLPQEYEATQWAGEYMMENAAVVDELWKKLAPAIQEYHNC